MAPQGTCCQLRRLQGQRGPEGIQACPYEERIKWVDDNLTEIQNCAMQDWEHNGPLSDTGLEFLDEGRQALPVPRGMCRAYEGPELRRWENAVPYRARGTVRVLEHNTSALLPAQRTLGRSNPATSMRFMTSTPSSVTARAASEGFQTPSLGPSSTTMATGGRSPSVTR